MSLLAGANLLVTGAAAAAGGALVAQALHLRGRRAADAWARQLMWLAAGLATVSVLHLASRFLLADLSVEYVFLYTRTDLPVHYRLAGVWAGREGSLLLWATILALVGALMLRTPVGRRDAGLEHARAWTGLFLLSYAFLFLLAAARQDTFHVTDEFFLRGRPLGNGLNPTLLSPYMLIHPPIQFVAYALATIPAAAAMAHMVTGTNQWSRISLTWTRAGWFLATAGLGLGGLWAYYTLGFGGYWAWDPVEVANLLPWLALTAYLHAQVHHLKYGRYESAGPLLAWLPLALTVLSTISTRSGLWVSVHAFTDPTNTFNPDAPGRFLDILAVEPQLLPYVGMFLATIAGALALWTRSLARTHNTWPRASRIVAGGLGAFAGLALVAPVSATSLLFEVASMVTLGRTGIGLLVLLVASGLLAAGPALVAPDVAEAPRKGKRLAWVNDRTLAYAAILTLSLGLLVIFLFSMASVNGWDRAFYDARLPYLAAPVLLGLIVYLSYGAHGRQRSLAFAGLALVLAIGAAAAFSAAGGAFLTLLAAAAAWAGFDRLHRSAILTRGDRRARLAGRLLLGAGLLNVAFWLNPPSRVGFGALSFESAWPIQLLGGVALILLYFVHRLLAGDPTLARLAVPLHLLVAALAGYVLAAPLALAALWLYLGSTRPVEQNPRRRSQRLRQVANHGLHMAVALLLVGFATSTYFAHELREEAAVGEGLELGSYEIAAGATESVPEADGVYQATTYVVVNTTRGGSEVGAARPVLYWEPQTGSHYPLPATLRLWHSDLYFDLDAVCIDPAGECQDTRDWVTSYQSSQRLVEGQEVTKVRLHALSLPGLSLVWAGFALFLFHGLLLTVTGARLREAEQSHHGSGGPGPARPTP